MFINKQVTCSLYCILFFSGVACAQSSLYDERKKELLNQINPKGLLIDPNLKKERQQLMFGNEEKVINKYNIKEKIEQYRNGGAQFEDKLTTECLKSSIKSTDLFKPTQGHIHKVLIINGKVHLIKSTEMDFIHDNLSQKHRLQGFKIEATVGGLNMSGFKDKRRTSTQSKNILIHVLGVDIDE